MKTKKYLNFYQTSFKVQKFENIENSIYDSRCFYLKDLWKVVSFGYLEKKL